MATTKKIIAAQPTANPGRTTHYPHTNGTVCGKRLSKAADYDAENPTCPTCAAWLRDTLAFTKRKHPSAFAAKPPTEPPAGNEG